MKTSVEISMYPLDAEYGTAILRFIQALRQYPEVEIRTNTMSTQIFGEYDVLMGILMQEIKNAFQIQSPVVMVMKIVNMDMR